jgi:predicted small secreted protein
MTMNKANPISEARWIVLAVLFFLLAGCGETIRGISKDGSRVVKGVKTIFVSGE